MTQNERGSMKSETLTGQCFCGQVRYQVQTPLQFVVHDHCSICRRIHGAAFVTWGGVVEATSFKLLAGAENLASFKSTPEAERQFCKTCGSHLFFRSSQWEDEIHFTLATITSEITHMPKAHVFFSDKPPWMKLEEDKLPKFGGESGLEPL